jgi:hypothetical protein
MTTFGVAPRPRAAPEQQVHSHPLGTAVLVTFLVLSAGVLVASHTDLPVPPAVPAAISTAPAPPLPGTFNPAAGPAVPPGPR